MSQELIIDQPLPISKEENTHNSVKDSEVENLSNKDIKYRAKYKEKVSELEEYKISVEKNMQELSQKLDSAEKNRISSENLRIESEIKAASVAAGLSDMDFIKLMDKSALKVNENGELTGVHEMIDKFKQDKPSCFVSGAPKRNSSSTNFDVSADAKAVPKTAYDIPNDQFARMLQNIPHSF